MMMVSKRKVALISIMFNISINNSRLLVHSAFSSRVFSTRSKYSFIHSSRDNILPLERPPDPSATSSSFSNQTIIEAAATIQNWLKNKNSVLCLTGAGMSTESGIPDYRGHKGSYFRGHKPIVHHEFMTSETARKRYWARSIVGYSAFANAQPNAGHFALALLEEKGLIGVNVVHKNRLTTISTITQNVDVLHSQGGMKNVLHLHGKGNIVRCMECGVVKDRHEYHNELFHSNQKWIERAQQTQHNTNDSELRPDGDADIKIDSYDDFVLPGCQSCGESEVMKTDVVFFGDSIPKDRVNLANAAVDASDGLLCIGTSLAVHSAFRLVKRATEKGIPAMVLNVGKTRAEKEDLNVTKIESPIGDTLKELLNIVKKE